MESLRVHQILRPVRYAFMVRADDRPAALKAACVNSVLWGGVFNPIIPTNPEDAMDGLLRTFDPDYLIDVTSGSLPPNLANNFKDRLLVETELVRQDEHGSPRRRLGIGFGITPILCHIHDNELRGRESLSRAALATNVPEPWLPYVLFSLGGFDALPDIGVDVTAAFKDLALADGVAFDPNAEDVDYRQWVFPLDATRYGIRNYRGSGSFSSHVAYFGDHSNINDLIEFWNIRATGRDAWFFPITHFQKYRTMLENIVNAGRYHINISCENHTDVQKGSSVTDDDFRSVTEWVEEIGARPVAFRDWSPRFGLSIDCYVGDIHAAQLDAGRAEEVTLFDGDSLTPVKIIRPSFLDEATLPKTHRWAVALSLENPATTDEWMCHLPRAAGMERLLREHIATSSMARLAGRGIVMCQDVAHETVSLFPMRTVDVINRLLEHAIGLKALQSIPGRYATQIIRKMGSLQFNCRIFKIRGVREIIHKLSNGSSLTRGDMHAIVRSTRRDDFGQNWRDDLYDHLVFKRGSDARNSGDIIDYLLENRVIRPGLTVQCDTCFASDWYHISEVSEDIVCRYCFEKQRVRFGSAAKWQYKSDGLFRLPNSVEGSLAVIVALWRLNEIGGHWNRGRYVTGVNLCNAQGIVEHELDYCWLDLDSSDSPYELVLGEAKSFNDYDEAKLARLGKLADRFEPRPYIALATLKDQFSDDEKAMLRKFVDHGYRLLPLTRLELDPYDLHARFENAPQRYPVGLKELSQNLVHVNV